jgi:two-component system, OmpR family, sensor kinase
MRSLRFRLAARVAGGMTAAMLVISIAGIIGARHFLDEELNASLLNVASIQAAALTDAPGGEMRFLEWDLTPEEAAQVRELNRYAQVWSEEGAGLLRTQYLRADLPLDSVALREAAAGQLVSREQRFQGLPIRSLYYPLERLGELHARHVLQVSAPLTGRNRMLRQLAWLLGGITIVVTASSFAGGWWLGGRMVRPVDEVIDQAESLGASDLDRRITAQADTREYRRLVDVLNLMLARLEHAFEAQRRFTADASHELRSPLTALRGEIELAMRRKRDTGEYERVLASNLQEVDRLSQLAEDLLTLARSDAGVMEPRLKVSDLAERAEAVANRLRGRAEAANVRVRLGAARPVHAVVDPALIDQLLWNLLDNAIKFTPAGGSVQIGVTATTEQVEIIVEDTGPGIRQQDRERIFDRFYRADAARTHSGDSPGTGLGLAIVRAIARAHGGEARAGAGRNGGARFSIVLPTAPPAATGGPGSPSESRRSGSGSGRR